MPRRELIGRAAELADLSRARFDAERRAVADYTQAIEEAATLYRHLARRADAGEERAARLVVPSIRRRNRREDAAQRAAYRFRVAGSVAEWPTPADHPLPATRARPVGHA